MLHFKINYFLVKVYYWNEAQLKKLNKLYLSSEILTIQFFRTITNK